jgi:DNA-directed RNA polymerase specialized sigma24 family protein
MVGYPPTRQSLIAALGDSDESTRRRAEDLLARAYWGPVNMTLRIRWRLDEADAADLTQEFFADALAKQWLLRFEPSRARFRTFLRVCVDRFAANAAQSAGRIKRRGGAESLSLDEALLVPAESDADADVRFHHEWVRTIFTMALDALRAEGVETDKTVHVALFEAYDVADARDDERPTYRALADRFQVPETQVTNYLAWARRTFRRHVLETLRALAGSETEFRADAAELLGITPP